MDGVILFLAPLPSFVQDTPMVSRAEELELFKTLIPLVDFCVSCGYTIDRRKSSRQSCFLRGAGDEKIVVSLNSQNNHFRYFSIDPADKGGTILDFTARHYGGASLGEVRKILRPWLNRPPLHLSSSPRPEAYPLRASKPDLLEVRREFTQVAEPLSEGRQRYLNEQRKITPNLLRQPRFGKAIFNDLRFGNALFPHRDRDGEITGFERRGERFQGFSKSGYKALWFADPGREERSSIVIAEAAIDAISYASIFYDPQACYMSTGGQLSPLQRELLQSAFLKLPAGASATIAADNDEPGERFAQTLKAIFEATGRSDLNLITHSPQQAGFDWNDELCRSL